MRTGRGTLIAALAAAAALGALTCALVIWHPLDADYYANRTRPTAPSVLTSRVRRAHLAAQPPDTTTSDGRAIVQAEYDRDREAALWCAALEQRLQMQELR